MAETSGADAGSSKLMEHGRALQLAFSDRLSRRNGYVEVPTALFVPKVDVRMPPLPSVAFYVWAGAGVRKIRDADQPYSPLALSAHGMVLVSEADIEGIRKFAERQILSAGEGGLSRESRMETLRRAAIEVVDGLFQAPTPENIKKSTKVVSSFVYVLMKEPEAYLVLAKLSSHDPYTLQHSVGTAVNGIILARKAGISDEGELNEVGMAGLLHDIGKTQVRREIINKEGPLNAAEWEEMKQHAQWGYDLVRGNPALSERCQKAVLEHHEDRIGKGYPGGLLSGDLHVFSRIVALADAFNALTTDRTYSKARNPFEAFQFINDKLNHKVDPELFRSLVLVYGGKMPAGTTG
ncbi:MAG: HD domain-containing protein [Bdellovibrionales bacterium]|nr:HD domain-containing protein [Bdellovibrionales bacterium]